MEFDAKELRFLKYFLNVAHETEVARLRDMPDDSDEAMELGNDLALLMTLIEKVDEEVRERATVE